MSVATVLHTCDYDPTRDKSYQATRLGRSIVDFLAWKKIGNTAERTLDQYERDLARGALMFPSVSLEKWGASEMVHVAASFNDKERRVRVAAWRSFFKWAILQELVDRNPCDKLHPIPQNPQRVIDVFDDTEIEILTGGLQIRDGALMQLLFDAGLRKGEARGLRVQDLHGHELAVTGKGNKQRKIPATIAVIQKLDELVTLDGLNPGDHFWYTRPGGHEKIARHFPVGENSFQTWWVRCLKDARVRYRNPHVTRHTFATRYLRRGGRMDKLAMAMGHASVQTTIDLYSHLDTRDLADEFASLFDTVEIPHRPLEV